MNGTDNPIGILLVVLILLSIVFLIAMVVKLADFFNQKEMDNDIKILVNFFVTHRNEEITLREIAEANLPVRNNVLTVLDAIVNRKLVEHVTDDSGRYPRTFYTLRRLSI